MKESFLASYRCIDNVYRKKSFSGQELNKFLSGLGKEDKPLTTKLVYGVLDRNIELTYIINKFAKVKPSVLPVMQIGVYCFLYLSIPDAVVVNECVELTKQIGKGGIKNFVNATLKNICRAIKNQEIKYPTDTVEFLSVKYSCPIWAVEQIIADYGSVVAEKILSYTKDDGFYHIRVNLKKVSADNFAELLQRQNIEYRKTLDDGFYVKGILDGIDKSFYTVQSLSSMYVCKALNCNSNDSVLDVCAAPGGKSIYIAQSGAKVTACDIHPHRVELIKKYANRMQTELTAQVNDAIEYRDDFAEKFDRVLCDVPCSGFGVISSKPDIKLFKTKDSVDSLTEIQTAILNISSKYVKIGGTLVYSTCTLFSKENKNIVDDFLTQNKNFAYEEIELKFDTAKDGYIQFLPYKDDTDGFFVAKIKRKY